MVNIDSFNSVQIPLCYALLHDCLIDSFLEVLGSHQTDVPMKDLAGKSEMGEFC